MLGSSYSKAKSIFIGWLGGSAIDFTIFEDH